MIVQLNSQNFSYTRMATSLNSKLSKRSVFSKPLPNKIPLKMRQNSQGNIQHLSYELQHYMLVSYIHAIPTFYTGKTCTICLTMYKCIW